MIYLLGLVVILFILFTAWKDEEARAERHETAVAHRAAIGELLTRLSHPELVVVPDPAADVSKEISLPDAEPEQDDYGMVGTIIPGVGE